MSRIDPIYGLLERTYRQGRLRYEVVDENPGAVRNSGFFPGGELWFRYSLVDGRLQGRGCVWYANGQLRLEESFHKGVRHGIGRSWHDNGRIQSETHYLNGFFEGSRREWYPDGRPKVECVYAMDRLSGRFTQWHPQGPVKERIDYWEGEPHGIWKEYDTTGRLVSCHLYLRGVRLTGRLERLLYSGRLTARHILRIHNAAVRRICLEELGYERFLSQVPHDVLQRQGDYELIRIQWLSEEEPIYLIKVRCPSTGAFYTLRVPPDVRSIQQAVAWTFGLTEKEYHPHQES